jgi:hypothetical protein
MNINVVASNQYVAFAENLTASGLLLVPSSLVIFSPESNFDQVLGSGNTAFIGWNANTESGPGLNFTYLYQMYNDSRVQVNPTLQLQEMQAVDMYIVKYGCVTPIVQVDVIIAYASNVHGLVYNSPDGSIETAYLSTS